MIYSDYHNHRLVQSQNSQVKDYLPACTLWSSNNNSMVIQQTLTVPSTTDHHHQSELVGDAAAKLFCFVLSEALTRDQD